MMMRRCCLHHALFLVLPAALWAQYSVSDLANLKDYESQRASSYDRSGGNHDYVSVDPGQTVTIFDQDGPGEIRHIWTTIPGWSEIYVHQKVVIRVYWDAETDPSIEAPIGNFLGYAFGNPPVFQSALITVNPVQALNSYIPMPFRSHARITITNEGSKHFTRNTASALLVRVGIRGTSTETISTTRARTRGGTIALGENNYVILDTQGDGQFVGVMMSVLNNQWGAWNEGDDMVFIDGEKNPRINGTGGEDYFNGAWGFGQLYSSPLVGIV